MSRSKGKGRVLALVLAAALVTSACNGDDDAESATSSSETTGSTTSTSESTTTTDPEAEPRAEVKAAYEAQWDAYVKILGDPDPNNPLINETFMAEAREAMLDTVSERAISGEATRRPENREDFVVKVTAVDITSPEEARVTACIVDGLVRYDKASGEVINDEVATGTDTATLRLDDGRWKVATASLEYAEGNPRCDDA